MLRIGTAFFAAILVIFSFQPAFADTVGLVRGVVNVNGKPTPGIAVTLKDDQTAFSTTTAPDGTFTFGRVPFGTYTVTAHRDGLTDVRDTVDVRTDAIASVAISLGELKTLGRTTATTRGVGGTPISQNAISKAQIAALPTNDSLNLIVQTVPGIVKFSFNEPVAHGFHGLIYEIDGAPLPQATSSNFAEIIDPKNVDSIEVFTGAFPAEFGGSRQGAVVNILTKRANDVTGHGEGSIELMGGTYGSGKITLSRDFAIGSARLFLNANDGVSARGLDSPTFVPVHDRSSQHDQFLRVITPIAKTNTLALDISNQFAQFQIPINPTVNPNDSVVNSPTQDDVQREYDRFINMVFTHTNSAGTGFFQIIPWVRYSRVVYAGDLAQSVNGIVLNADGSTSPLNGLQQDRVAKYQGLRLTAFHASDHHAIKYGVDGQLEGFRSNVRIVQTGSPDFADNVAQNGSALGAYIQDKWTPSRQLAINLGLRYDRSTGFVGGNQLSPRLEVNYAPDAKNIVHGYLGRFYAAPNIEDVRREAVITATTSSAAPVYDLQPERDTYTEVGVSHTFAPRFSGYFNYWTRNVANVLDTAQLSNTPIFALFNNAVGRAEGLELRLDQRLRNSDTWFLSASVSRSYAAGVSGGTFVVNPASLPAGLQPEDHDQSVEANGAYTHRFGSAGGMFATVQTEYGTGYPVQFQSGPARLPAHLTFDLAVGREAQKGRLGFALTAQNITNRKYVLKLNNGFNTTQWAPGAALQVKISAPL